MAQKLLFEILRLDLSDEYDIFLASTVLPGSPQPAAPKLVQRFALPGRTNAEAIFVCTSQ